MNLEYVLKVPGMLTSEEKLKLIQYASRCSDGTILELGCFFGASTVALATGLIQGKRNVPLIAVDAFKVATAHPFSKRVMEYANLYGLKQALRVDSSSIDFFSIPKAYLDGWSSNVCTLLQRNIDTNERFEFAPREISMLHLDLPKDAATMKPIAKHIFPLLKNDSIVAFQDHGYHFSGELIAFFEYLMEAGYLELCDYSGSTLYSAVRIRETLSSDYFLKALYKSQLNPVPLVASALQRVSCIANPTAQASLLLAQAHTLLNLFSDIEAQNCAANIIGKALEIGDKNCVLIALAELLSERVTQHIS